MAHSNKNYLDSISRERKNLILKNVANHYGISIQEAEQEVIDEDAEMLYEYIANDASLRMSVYNDFKGNKYANGGSVNTGRSWHLDRQKHNKSESWEKPMSKRKQRYDDGGGVSDILINKINRINEKYDGLVVASKTYSDNRIQVVSPYFNTLNEIKRNEFEGSGLLEKYGNTSQYVLYSNSIFDNGGGVGEKYKYIKLYNERIDKAIEDSIKETGKQTEDTWNWIASEGDFTAEEIAGYYLKGYKDEALSTWLENVKHSVGHDTDEKVTEILKGLSGVSYAKGGGINSGRDLLFKSKQPHEQKYQRKNEWKEYKKEGWFGDWFADGGGVGGKFDIGKEWNDYLKESRVDTLVEAGYSKNVAKDLSFELWDSLEKSVQNDFKNILLNEEIESTKEMIESIYTYNYGKVDKNDKYLLSHKQKLGEKLFDKIYKEHIKELQKNYEIKTDVGSDSEGVTYNSLTRKLESGGGVYNENSEMVINNNKQIRHHTEELSNIVTHETKVPAWVVAKVNRSASDLSDATHYLDGAKGKEYANGGTTMTNEGIVRDSMVNGEIHCDTLTEIIGHKPNYPHQIVGSLKLTKCYLKPYYKI